MRGLLLASSVAVAAILSGSAFADDQRQLLCKPLNTSQSSYTIACQVQNGVLQPQGCSCNAGFILVDPNAKPGEVPPRNSSEP